MRVALALTKRLFAFSAGDVIVFGSVVAILMIVFAELGLPLVGAAAVALSWWLGWALGRLVDLHPAAHRKHGSLEEGLQRAAVFEALPTDFDGLGS